MSIKDFKVGQKVYVLLVGDMARGKSREDQIEEWEVIALGRKYVTASKFPQNNWCGIAFDSTDGFREKKIPGYGNINYIMYADKQEIYDEWEKLDLLRDIRSIVDYRYYKRFSLESLRKAKAALTESEVKTV